MVLFSSKNFRFFLLGVVLVVTALAFLPCLKNGFVNWDDDVQLLNNLHVRSLSPDNIRAIFRQAVLNIYIPLTTLSFSVEYRFFGYSPFIYHLDNLLLHLAVVALVWVFCRQCGLSPGAAAVAALVFGIHPTRVESVAWVTERKDVLYAFFYMLALVAYCRYLTGKNKMVYSATIALSLLSMLAKPMALSLPLVFLCCDWFFKRRLSYRIFVEKIPHVLVIVPIAWITYALHARLPGNNLLEAALIWVWSFVFYIFKFLYPAVLVPLYEAPQPVAITDMHYILALGVLTGMAIGLFYFRKKRWIVFAFLFYFCSIFFLLRFDTRVDTNIVADRFMYLPTLGFCLCIGIILEAIFNRWRNKKIFESAWLCVCASFFALLFLKTLSQSSLWSNSIALWSHQLRYYPKTSIALNDLATAYSQEALYKGAVAKYKIIRERALSKEEALRDFKQILDDIDEVRRVILLYRKAIEINPGYADALYNLGKVYQDLGRNYEAAVLYRRTLELDSRYKDSLFSLATIYRDIGSPREAVEAYRKTIDAEPDNEDVYLGVIKAYSEAVQKNDPVSATDVYKKAREEALGLYKELVARKPPLAISYFNLGSLYAEMSDYPKAVEYYKKALAINPEHIQTLYNLGNAYGEIGQPQEAVAAYKKVIVLNPKYEDIYLNLGVAYNSLKDYTQAVTAYQKAIEIKPNHANAYFNLGFTYEAIGEAQEAVVAYRKAIAIDPQHVQGYYNLGNVYAALKDNQDAIAAYQKAIEINPNHGDAFVNLVILCIQEKDFKQAGEYADKAKAAGVEIPGEYLKVIEANRAP